MMSFFPRAWKRRVKPSPSPEVAPIIKMVFIEEVISAEGDDDFAPVAVFCQKASLEEKDVPRHRREWSSSLYTRKDI